MHHMTITKCDDCGAVIERTRDAIGIGHGLFSVVQLCASCGAPAAVLLARVIAKRRTAQPQPEIKA